MKKINVSVGGWFYEFVNEKERQRCSAGNIWWVTVGK